MKLIMALSGGMDSATLLGAAKANKEIGEICCVTMKYGSNHNPYEIECAKHLCKIYEVEHIIFDVEQIFTGFNSALMGDNEKPIPHGHYEDENMKQTVIPGRNLIFASILAGIAESKGYDLIGLGVHAGDHAIYPDCRPEFIASLDLTIKQSTEGKVSLWVPFISIDKTHILQAGLLYEVPYQFTRTCYEPQELSCGKCGSCVERLEAFGRHGLVDPIEYAD